MLYVNLLMLSAIICYIIDISGVVDSLKYAIWRWLFNGKREYEDFRLKPFDCSLCMCFWSGLIYLLITQSFTIWAVGYVCLLSHLSTEITAFLYTIKDGVKKLIILFNNLID